MIHSISPLINLEIEKTVEDHKKMIFIVPAGPAYEEKQRILNGVFFRKFGEWNVDFIMENPLIVFRAPVDFFVKDLNANSMGEINSKVGPLFIEIVDWLWFIKDNAVGLVSIFNYTIDFQIVGHSQSNFHPTNSSGTHTATKFTSEELNQMFSMRANFPHTPRVNSSVTPADPTTHNEGSSITLSTFNFMDYNIPRVDVAFNFLKLLRNSSYLPVKIGFYISLIEALATITTERDSRAKTLRRVPPYIDNDPGIQATYKSQLDEAYEFRNKFAHGQVPTIDDGGTLRHYRYDDFKLISNNLDNIARLFFTKVLTFDVASFNGSDAQHSAFWAGLGLLA